MLPRRSRLIVRVYVRFSNVCLALAVLSAPVFASGADLVISKRGGTDSIAPFLPEDASPSERHAAEELESYVRRMTGSGLRVPVAFRRPPSELGDDGFALRVRNGRLEVIGGKRGILYAVYDLLERFGGCGWYSSTTTVVPEVGEFRIPGDLKVVERPAFAMRTMTWFDVMHNPEYAVKLRINGNTGPALSEEQGGIAYMYVGGLCHTFNSLLPPEKWFAEHPEYFCERDGRRRGGRDSQPCLTNPDVLRIVTENALSLVTRFPRAKIISVSENDNGNYCQCERCAAVDEAEGSHSGALIRFVNAVADEIGKARPDMLVQTLCYLYSQTPPRLTKPRPNVTPFVCPMWVDRNRPIAESESKHSVGFLKDLAGWGRMNDNLYVWDYTVNFRNYLYPFPVEHTYQPNMKLFRDHGVKYMFAEGGRTHADFAELKAWLLAKWMWSPDTDEKALLDRFFKGYYGAAAVPMRRYFERCRAGATGPDRESIGIFENRIPKFYTEAFLAETKRDFDAALKSVRGDPVRAENVRAAAIVPLVVELDRAAESAKWVFVTRKPDRFPRDVRCEKVYGKVLKTVEKWRDQGFRFCAADAWEEGKLASWKRSFGEDGGRIVKSDRAEVGCDGFVYLQTRTEKVVDDPDALNGKAMVFEPMHGDYSISLPFRHVAYDAAARYAIKFRVKVERDVRNGAAFQARLGPSGNGSRDAEELVPDVGDVGTGWTWYAFEPRTLRDDLEFTFGSGPWDKGGGIGTTKAVYFDRLEIVRK